MVARLISVAGQQWGFLGVRNIISVILRLQDFVTNRPRPISLCFNAQRLPRLSENGREYSSPFYGRK